jgi:hypothetical protein
MGESYSLFTPEFNHSLRIESRSDRLTGDGGAVVIREIIHRLGLDRWLTSRLRDPRRKDLVTHPLSELLRTALILLAQGWHDQDDADRLRHDPALRLAVSDRRGVSPLSPTGRDPEGLASQPTLSRLLAMLSTKDNRTVLRESLLTCAARRLKAMRQGHRLRYVTVDIDSLPVEVHGHQPQSEHNGHYHARIYHPLIALCAETEDLLDVRLRPGAVHTADGADDFILELLDRTERELCQVASVRMDAGFPSDDLLTKLEARGTAYVARLRNNAVLDRLAQPLLRRPRGRRPAEPRVWTHEFSHRAGTWSGERRLVLVVLERTEELFMHHFWLVTNWTAEQMSGESLLKHYRQRGTAEGHFGELMNVLAPALSSTPRTKTHYRGRKLPQDEAKPCDGFAHNETILLLNALAFNLVHTARVMISTADGRGWSLQRVHERILRVAGRVLLHGRRATLIICQSAAHEWSLLWTHLQHLHHVDP